MSARTTKPAAARTAARKTPARKAPARRPAPVAWRIVPVTPERWRDFTILFGARGACGGCWCTWCRFPHAQYKSTSPIARRAWIQRLVRSGGTPGLIAYDGDTPAGWIAVGPREDFARYATSRALAPVDEQPTWSAPCFFVARAYRGRGLTVALLRAACTWAASHGARRIEGYPVDTRGRRQASAFVWTGVPGAFEAAGFREVLRRTPARPIMRRTLRPSRARAKAR